MADGNDLPPKLYIIEKDDPGRDSGGPRYRLTRWRDLMIKPGPRTLVDGLIPAKGNVTVVAGWNGGKSVFASNLALCVAAGLPFAGLTTLQGPVVYNVGEGNGSFVRRLADILRDQPFVGIIGYQRKAIGN